MALNEANYWKAVSDVEDKLITVLKIPEVVDLGKRRPAGLQALINRRTLAELLVEGVVSNLQLKEV